MSGQLTGNETLEELRQIVGQMRQDIEWLMQGRISSKNIREVGGYNVNQTDLVSKDGNVGLSSANDSADPIRMFAGSSLKDFAPWRVTQSGKMFATGATIESQGSYPKISLDPSGNVLGVYSSPTVYLSFNPIAGSFTAPQITFINGTRDANIYQTAFLFNIQAIGDIGILAAGGELNLDGDHISAQWSKFTNGIGGQSLQSALSGKANAFSGFTGSFTVSLSGGGTRTLTFSNGILVS